MAAIFWRPKAAEEDRQLFNRSVNELLDHLLLPYSVKPCLDTCFQKLRLHTIQGGVKASLFMASVEERKSMVGNRLKSKDKKASQPIIIYTRQQKYGYDQKHYIYLNQNIHSTKYPFNTDLFPLMSFP